MKQHVRGGASQVLPHQKGVGWGRGNTSFSHVEGVGGLNRI